MGTTGEDWMIGEEEMEEEVEAVSDGEGSYEEGEDEE